VSDVSIRVATEADLDGLTASQAGLFAEDAGTRDPLRNPDWPRQHGAANTKANIANPDRLVLASDVDGAVVGHLLGGYFPVSDMWIAPRAELISMFVRPDWRGHAVGSGLVEAFKVWARERGAVQLRVTAYAANDGAIRFYQRHGFAPLDITFASTS
jgi:GNAT superfamily N-acetyltransferase